MTTYKNIKGKRIKTFETDLGNEQAEGQIFYQDTANEFKTAVASAAWHSGGGLIDARRSLAGSGTQTAGLAFGGIKTGPATAANTEEYNGSGWGQGGDLGTARSILGGTGTQTAALGFGGFVGTLRNETEEYNGSSWSEQNNLNTARYSMGGAGTQTAALAFGGQVPNNTGVTEEYDGTSWSEQNDLNTARGYLGGCGTQTAGLAFAGSSDPDATEHYDGTSWTTVNNMNTGRIKLAGAGIQTSALAFGGYNPPGTLTATESYNGTTWATAPSLANALGNLAGAGSSKSSALAFGGASTLPAISTTTEEFNITANTVTAAAWSSIANFPDSRAYSAASGGTPTSTLVFGGYTGPGLGGFVSSGAEFNGSSWTATGDYVIDVVGVAGLGPITAGLGCGGYKDNATNVTTCAEYDGSSWTSANGANAAGQGAKMAGTQTAGSMGNRSGDGDGHEQYDGTNWTTATNTPVSGNAGAMMAGTQTALLMYGAESSGNKKRTEEYDGSSWTSGNNMNLDRRQGSHGGTQTYAIAGGGDSNPGIFGNTELWDGTSWASSANMGTARFYQVGGTSVGPSGVTGNIAATGRTPGSTHSNNCEEFTGETTSLNLKTITDS